MAKYSVIIPVYNVASYLRECLESLVAQSHSDWEAICVDDGSSDESGAILDEYARKDVRFHVVHQINSGTSVARNLALKQACGDYVCFLDGDDVVGTDWMENYEHIFSKDKSDLVHIEHTDWYGELPFRARGLNQYCKYEDRLSATKWAWKYFVTRGFICGYAIRREVLEGLQFPEGVRYSEDTLFALSFVPRLRSLSVSEYNGYFYRKRRGSAANAQFDCQERALFFSAWIERREKMMKEVAENHLSMDLFLQAEQDMLCPHFFSWLSRPNRPIEKGTGLEELLRMARAIHCSSVKPRWRFLFAVFKFTGCLRPLYWTHAAAVWIAGLLAQKDR